MSAEAQSTADMNRYTTPPRDPSKEDEALKLAQNTPLNVNCNSLKAGFMLKNERARNRYFAREMLKCAIGTIPMDKLLRKAFPNTATTQAVKRDVQNTGTSKNTGTSQKQKGKNTKPVVEAKEYTDHFKDVPRSVSNEIRLYVPLVCACLVII